MFLYEEYMQSVPISLLLANVTVCFRYMCLCEHDLDELEHWGDSGKYTYFLICYSSNESRSPIISLTVFFVLQLKKNSLTVVETN
jgi:hypothetical protein